MLTSPRRLRLARNAGLWEGDCVDDPALGSWGPVGGPVEASPRRSSTDLAFLLLMDSAKLGVGDALLFPLGAGFAACSFAAIGAIVM